MLNANHVSDRQKDVDGRASLRLSQQSTSIGTLSDDVLREIFKSYLDRLPRFRRYEWPTLAQVCQRWRHVIIASPHFLDLQLICTTRRPVRGLMSGWPALPIAIVHTGNPYCTSSAPRVESVDNIIAALERNDRVLDIRLSDVPGWQLDRFERAMQKPFPELISLDIGAGGKGPGRMPPMNFPDSFLGGSVPRLQSLRLDGIPFPGLPKLLLSSHDLVHIHLYDTPPCGPFEPEEMATCLSPLKLLKSLDIKFNARTFSFLPRTSWQHNSPSPSPTRTVLPALTSLQIHCDSPFLEGLVSRLDVPSLEKMQIQILQSYAPVPNISELPQFISRIETFRVKTFDKAEVAIHHEDIQFIFSSQTSSVASAELSLTFVPTGSLRDLIRDDVCSLLPPLTRFKCLMLRCRRMGIGGTELRQILYSCTAVTDIFLSGFLAVTVSHYMKGLSEERATAMLPALQNISVANLESQADGTIGGIQKFIAVRGLAGHPVTLHSWKINDDE